METERIYFELGALVEPLAGAELAWTPDFVGAPASAVVHRIDLARCGPDWLDGAESRLAELGIGLSRIYLRDRDARIETLLHAAGYVRREELVFVGDLPDPSDPPRGCAFHTRCPQAMDICRTARPALEPLAPDHYVACHLHAPAAQAKAGDGAAL